MGAGKPGIGVLRKERRQERDSQRSARPIRCVPAARRPGGGRVGVLSRDAGKSAAVRSPDFAALNRGYWIIGHSSVMSAIGTESTWCPCCSLMVTNHPCQLRPGLALPCLSLLASLTAYSRVAALADKSIPLGFSRVSRPLVTLK